MKTYMGRNKYTFHVISNTHWDREWRFPFQINRQMLVDMIDKAIAILENNPTYKAYHLDSQSIVIEDYLEIKPHNRERISKLVKDKRLFIGPWYVLPEEFQVGGENLIRNLLIGHKICKEIGRVSKTGYSPFSWGQISQLPQIYSNFGIDFIIFYRGINSLDSPKAEFIWEGADGTQILSSRLSTMPRYNFYFYIYRPVLFNELPSTLKFSPDKKSFLFHFADSNLYKSDYFNPKPAVTYFEENIKTQVEKIIQDQAKDFTTPHIIWMEGHDSSGPNEKTIQIINDIKKYFPDLNVIHSTLEDYIEAVKNSIDISKLKLVKGERRSTQYDLRSGNLYGYTTSARMDLKIKNFDCERWLQYYAEPFYNFASINGLDTNDKYLEIAWKLLIQNSAHDSIGGCSLDIVHEDMINRYKQVKEISTGLFSKAIQFLVTLGEIIEKENLYENYLTCINPSSYDRSEVVKFVIDVPVEFAKDGIKILDLSGKSMEVQISKVETTQPVLEQMIDRPMYVDIKRYTGYALLDSIPSFGLKTFKVIPSEKNPFIKKIAKKIKDKIILENDYLKVTINKNGTFNILHKDSNRKYSNLGYLYDEGEGGHAWVHKSFKPFVTTLKSQPEIKLIENGPLFSKVLIKHKFKIPERKLKIMSGKIIKTPGGVIPIDIELIISKTSQRIDLKINLTNTIENHRLRIMFPSKLNAQYHYGEGQFDVVKRPIKRIDASNWVEPPMYDFPLHNFVDVNDGNNGLAIIVDGLKEYEILDNKNRTIALTLLRAFSYVIVPSSTEEFLDMKGSQCLGKHEFKLSIFPHRSNWDAGNVFPEAIKFNQPLSLVETNSITSNNLIPNSFIRIQPENLIFSCFKKGEDGKSYVLRIFNPTDNILHGAISLHWTLKEAFVVNLEELVIEKINFNNNSINLVVPPKKIVSLKLIFN